MFSTMCYLQILHDSLLVIVTIISTALVTHYVSNKGKLSFFADKWVYKGNESMEGNTIYEFTFQLNIVNQSNYSKYIKIKSIDITSNEKSTKYLEFQVEQDVFAIPPKLSHSTNLTSKISQKNPDILRIEYYNEKGKLKIVECEIHSIKYDNDSIILKSF